jgi:cell surface protein SprA
MLKSCQVLENKIQTHQDIKGEVWFDELCLVDMDTSGGMAAVLNVDTDLADFATISATGKMSTIDYEL